ncbi:MAG TPA: hypothetical protein VFI93_06145 [Rhizomicrobium sp.]|nr:hypothetical protein [Rhizomicrobium sp.]
MAATGPVAAALPSKCARPDEVTSIQVAAIQQELMVAALTCSQIDSFNAFQTGYSKELRSSDAMLHKMFRRLYGRSQGAAEYHAFKTRLANDSSIRSIRNNRDYCEETKKVFIAALGQEARPTLAAFVSGIQVREESPVNSCEIRVAVGLQGVKTAPNVVPKPNPMRVAMLTPADAPANVAAPAVTDPNAPQQTAATAAQPGTPAQPADASQKADSTVAAKADADPAKEKKKSGWLSNLFN